MRVWVWASNVLLGMVNSNGNTGGKDGLSSGGWNGFGNRFGNRMRVREQSHGNDNLAVGSGTELRIGIGNRFGNSPYEKERRYR